MRKKLLLIGFILLTNSWTLQAMGKKADKDDAEFDAKAEGHQEQYLIKEVIQEQKADGLPSQPSEVDKDAAKDFSGPFFKKTEAEQEPATK